MTDILKHTVCFGNNTIEPETEMQSMCTTDVVGDIKEENESGTDDDVDALRSLSREVNTGDKNIEITTAKVKDGQIEVKKNRST